MRELPADIGSGVAQKASQNLGSVGAKASAGPARLSKK